MKSKIIKTVCYILAAILFSAGIVCGHTLFVYFEAQAEQHILFQEIADTVGPAELIHEVTASTDENLLAITENNSKRLSLYKELSEYNPDMIGWVRIKHTTVNYPVMYTPDSPSYYLKRNFYKEYSELGTPFLQETCTPNSPHLILYGHHMLAGGMFSDLDKYKNKDYWKEHRTIRFDTLDEIAEYEIFAVVKTVAYGYDSFRFYDYNCETEENFDKYISECKKRSLYDIELIPDFGDKLLTLATCEYSAENGRLLVVARKITNKCTQEK